MRPGGLILFITSKGTLDKHDTALREYVSQQADLVGAIRFPNDAFKKNANTEVATDIVMLRKRLPGELPSGPTWRPIIVPRDSAPTEETPLPAENTSWPRLILVIVAIQLRNQIDQQILHFRQKVVAFRHLKFLEKISPLRGAGKRVKA